jgi:HSP20 family protein
MVTRAWNPFNEMVTLREAMNQLLEGSFVRPGTAVLGASGAANAYTFPINVYGTADELKVEALLPGVSPEDVQVDIDRGVLTIAAKRHGWEPQEGQHQFLREITSGQFSRSLGLPFPVEVERANADFVNGVLTLTLPKAEAAKPKRIQIGGGRAQEQLTSTAQQ